MDILVMVACATVVIGVLVFIHEGGHYAASRLFGVRVTEFMLGLPGPSIGFKAAGTRFGVTAIPLGGYARVCGMEPGEMSPHLEVVLAALYRRGTADMEDIARDCGVTNDEAYEALEELVEWGSCTAPTKKDEFNTYRAAAVVPSKKRVKAALAASAPAPLAVAEGVPREVPDAHALFESEYAQQYRSLPFWKRSVILLSGVGMNLLFAVLVFVVIYSVIGFDLQNTETGEVFHRSLTPLQSVQVGLMYIGMVVQQVIALFNPATTAQVMGDSASIVGIAVMSKGYFEAGAIDALLFMAMISVSLGIMNLVPIPPLDGGRFVVEVFQKITRKLVSLRFMNAASMAGMALFFVFFAVMMNQDIQRFVFGNWG